MIQAQIEERTLPLLVDTGASYTTLSATFVRRLRQKEWIGRSVTKLADGTPIPIELYRIPQINIAGCTARNVIVYVLAAEMSRGLLGYDTLKQMWPVRFDRDGVRFTCQ